MTRAAAAAAVVEAARGLICYSEAQARSLQPAGKLASALFEGGRYVSDVRIRRYG